MLSLPIKFTASLPFAVVSIFLEFHADFVHLLRFRILTDKVINVTSLAATRPSSVWTRRACPP